MMKNNEKHYSRRRRIMIIAAVLVLIVSAGSSVAFIMAKTGPLQNTFSPAEVSCRVDETFNGTSKSNVSIENTGDVNAYIRAEIVVTWQDGNGNVYGNKPASGDYNMTLGSGWSQGSDGYYYWPQAVAPDGNTGNLITSASEISGKAPTGYHLCIEVLGSAIQSEGNESGSGSQPVQAIKAAWGVGPSGN